MQHSDSGLENGGQLGSDVLSDEQWEQVSPLLPGKIGDPGRSGSRQVELY